MSVADVLASGACKELSRFWNDPPRSADAAVDVRVIVGGRAHVPQCVTTNDEGLLLQTYCKTE